MDNQHSERFDDPSRQIGSSHRSSIRVKPEQIVEATNSLYALLEESGSSFTRSARRNMILPALGPGSHQQLHTIISELVEVHPSRMFMVVEEESSPEISIEVSARCVQVSKTEHSCSELIELTTPWKLFPAVASVIRSNLISGMPIELAVFDPSLSVQALQQFGPLTDVVITDTALFRERPEVLRLLRRLAGQIIDLQWLRLSSWRGAFRAIFDRLPVRTVLPTIESIQIEGERTMSELLLGWLVARLGAKVVCDERGARIQLPGSAPIAVEFRGGSRQGASPAAIDRVSIRTTSGSIELERRERAIAILVELGPRGSGQSFRFTQPIEDESREALLRRFFLIGESTTNYNAAFEQALHLSEGA